MPRRSVVGGLGGVLGGLLEVGWPAERAASAVQTRAAGLLPNEATGRSLSQLQIHPRAQWRAKPPRRPTQIIAARPDHIVVHHTASTNSASRSLKHAFALSRGIQRFHMKRHGWIDIGQQLTISRGGHVMEGRSGSLRAIQTGRHVVGAQTLHHNRHTIGIENEGSYVAARPPAALWTALVETCVWLCAAYELDPFQAIVGHRDYNATACPGTVLYARLPRLRREVAVRLDSVTRDWPDADASVEVGHDPSSGPAFAPAFDAGLNPGLDPGMLEGDDGVTAG